MPLGFARRSLLLGAGGIVVPGCVQAADPPPPGQRPPPPPAQSLAAPGLLRGTVLPEGVQTGQLGSDAAAAAQRSRNGTALQASIDRAADARRFFELPPGRYEIDRPGGLLVGRENFRWIGSRGSQVVQYASNTPALHVGRPLAERRGSISGVVIDGARLDYATDQGDQPEANLLQLNRIWMARFENLELGDPHASRGTRTPRSHVALRLRDTGAGAFVFSCSFRDIRARCFGRAGLLWDAPGTGNLFQNCYFSNVAGDRPRGRVVRSTADSVTIEGIEFGGAAADPVRAMLRIVSGPGAGQIREVAARNGMTLRMAQAWAVPPGAGASVQLHLILRATEAGISVVRGEAGNQFDSVFEQCNVEWIAAPGAVRLLAVRGMVFRALHVEGVVQMGRGLVTLVENSTAEFAGGAFYDNVLAAPARPEMMEGAALLAVSAGAQLAVRGTWVDLPDDNRSALPYAMVGSTTGRPLARPASVELELGLDRARVEWSALDLTEVEGAARAPGQSVTRFNAAFPQAERAQVWGDADAVLHWGQVPRIAVFRGLSAPRVVRIAGGYGPQPRLASLRAPGGASFRIVNESTHALRIEAEGAALAEVAPGRFLDVAETVAGGAGAAARSPSRSTWSVTATGGLQ